MWEDSLNVILESDSADFGNMASILVDLFEGVVTPDIFLTHTNKVAVQQVFSVKVRYSNCKRSDEFLIYCETNGCIIK